MIELEVVGLNEAVRYLTQLGRRAARDTVWQGVAVPAMEDVRRRAMSISPVITGSYRGSHRLSISGKNVRLHIDPQARNAGVSVASYADDVERRHRVYARTAAQARRMGVSILEDLRREVIK